MASGSDPLHFAIFPLMGQGHLIPMVDIAKLLAQRGIIITLFLTSEQALRVQKTLSRAIASGLQIHLVFLDFPTNQTGLPEGCESLDHLPSSDLLPIFFSSLYHLQNPAEKLFADLKPQPNCIISDSTLPWTLEIATKFNIPWISFSGTSCFCPGVSHKIYASSMILSTIASDDEYFTVPDLPDEIRLTKAQLPSSPNPELITFFQQLKEAEDRAFGRIVNSFEELETHYVEEQKRSKSGNVWCIGPVSLCNENEIDKADRGNQASITDEAQRCLKWLNSQNPDSVIYVCLGSLCSLSSRQLIELGLGLEASKMPFLWVIRTANEHEELEKWIMEDGFEERVKKRGVLIRGWAPQVLILSHPAVGGFLTHCGWNSTLEAISTAVPMITWPLFSEQFLNEKQVVNVLKIGVRIGAERPVKWGGGGEEEMGEIQVKREDVKEAIEKVMGEDEEVEKRRKKVRDLGELAKKAVGDGGSSQLNITILINEIRKMSN